MTDFHLSPAYGRDYKSKAAVKIDWETLERDFIINAPMEHSGKVMSIRDCKLGDNVYIRYNNQRQVCVIKIS